VAPEFWAVRKVTLSERGLWKAPRLKPLADSLRKAKSRKRVEASTPNLSFGQFRQARRVRAAGHVAFRFPLSGSRSAGRAEATQRDRKAESGIRPIMAPSYPISGRIMSAGNRKARTHPTTSPWSRSYSTSKPCTKQQRRQQPAHHGNRCSHRLRRVHRTRPRNGRRTSQGSRPAGRYLPSRRARR
jgi:hypothetical protein